MYIFTRESFWNAEKHRIGHTPYFYEVDEIESIDIDYEKDFYFAETIFKKFKDYI
jgi:CMP-N-acetylneuraminic acid synthetase